MNYIVFDLEWNQPVNAAAAVTEPVYLAGEIIEIGAVKLNEKFEALEELKIYVKPVCYTTMHRKVASLTRINNSCLARNGVPFPEAYESFLRWCGEDYAFMTWSESDLPMLIDNMLLHGLDVSRMPVCFDVQRIFDREIMRSERQYSLDSAVAILGEQGDQAHDALHDARNTVRVCDHLDLEVYIDEYGSQIFAEKPQQQVYESISEILHRESNAEFICPRCGERIVCEGWIQMNNHRFMALGVCPEGDEFILYLNITKCSGGFRLCRMIYEMSDDLWDRYMDRLEARGLITCKKQAA